MKAELKSRLKIAGCVLVAVLLLLALVFGGDVLSAQVMFVLLLAGIGVGGYFVLKWIQRVE